MHRRTLAAFLAAPAIAQAQAWPGGRPVRIVVPWTPGQATDIVARLFADGLGPRIGTNFVIENRAGAGGSIGTDAVAKAAPDGFTLLGASSGPISINPLVQRMPYDVERDLTGVALGGMAPFVLVSHPSFPAQSIMEFVARLRAQPGRFTFASSGTGATAHLITEFFNSVAGVQAVHVPFQGSAPALTAILGGQVDFTMETAATTMPHVRAGRLRAYGVSLRQDTPLAEGVAPIARSLNAPEFDIGAWIGLMAPAATPPAIIERLSAASLEWLAEPTTRERFTSAGLQMQPMSAAAMNAFLRDQRAVYENVVRRANLSAG